MAGGGWSDWGDWANMPIGSCGPVRDFKLNASATLTSAELHQRGNGTRYVTIDWHVSGCFDYRQQAKFVSCELSTTIKVSWPGGLNEIVKPVYTDSCLQVGTDNIDVAPSASSYTVEVKVHAECWVWYIIWSNIGREDASASCVIYP